MPIDAGEIKEYRKLVAKKDRQAALREIANKKPVEIVQYVYSILQDGIQATQAKPGLENTFVFFQETEVVMKDLKHRLETYQEKGITHLLSILSGLSREKVEGNLNKLLVNIKNVTITADMIDLYREAQLWLEGWHRHTYNSYPPKKRDPKTGEPLRDKTGVYLNIDNEDWIFRKVIGIPQLVIAEYYRDAAIVLHEKIDAFQNQQEAKREVEPVIAESAADNASPAIQVQHRDGQTTITVTMNSLDTNLIARVANAIQVACHAEPVSEVAAAQPVASAPAKTTKQDRERGWQEIFDLCEMFNGQQDDEGKMEALMSGLSKYGLTDEQKASLSRLKANIDSQLDSYTKNTYGMLGFSWSRAHEALANAAKRDVAMSKDPADMISILYDLRTDLIRENSDSLLPKVNGLLLSAYKSLYLAPENRVAHAVGMR